MEPRDDPNNPALESWVEVPPGSDFPVQNLPLGVFEAAGREPRLGVAIGEQLLDLAELASLRYFEALDIPDLTVFSQETLNAFLALGKPRWRAVRGRVSELLRADHPELRNREQHRRRVLLEQGAVRMLLPIQIGDFVDFYSSLEHATNVGRMFRPNNPLMPNWRHLPVGYHGRTSSVIVSGRDVRRPHGQLNPRNDVPEFAASRRLDFELEMGFVVGQDSALGERIGAAQAEDYIFGMVLLNDWSARDIQKWEYVPLGPFLGKSFATSISPWVVTLDALTPFRTAGPLQDPPVLPYLQVEGDRNLDLDLEVYLQPETESEPMRVCHSNFQYMYWNMAQQLAHLTSNGSNVRVGDLCGSGTVSGPEPGSFGSLLEITENGAKPIVFPGGAQRTFLEDYDMIVMKAYGYKDGVRVGFGELRARVLPAV